MPTALSSTTPAEPAYVDVREGAATVRFEKGHVFYNPVQVFNRDLSIAAIRAFGEIYFEEQNAKAAKRAQAQAQAGLCSDWSSFIMNTMFRQM